MVGDYGKGKLRGGTAGEGNVSVRLCRADGACYNYDVVSIKRTG
jgi:hypothetical protein